MTERQKERNNYRKKEIMTERKKERMTESNNGRKKQLMKERGKERKRGRKKMCERQTDTDK